MIPRNRILKQTALLTGVSLLMSLLGMSFQAWLAARIGAAGIGLYQLALSVTNLAATFAVSGIRFSTTRLIAEELGQPSGGDIRAMLNACLRYAAVFGLAAGAILLFFAEPLGAFWIGDARTVLSLRIAAISMPCISLCASLSGYLTACGRAWKACLIHLAEQLVGIALTAFLLFRISERTLERTCAAVMLGHAGADLLALGFMLFVCKKSLPVHRFTNSTKSEQTRRLLRIALPLAVSAYARSALSTLRHLLVPRGLKAAGLSAESALAGYGIVQGMVLPVLLFPICLLTSLSELIVPELTKAQVRGNVDEIKTTAGKLIWRSLQYSLAVGLFLYCTADALGTLLWRSREAGRYLRLLSPLVPILYADVVIDGCLKGLGQQVWCMGINILEAAVGLILLCKLLPVYGLPGYLVILAFTEIFNAALSLGRLLTVLRGRPASQAEAAQRSPEPPGQTA